MRRVHMSIGAALAIAAAQSYRVEIDPRVRDIELRPDHVPREEVPQIEIARRAEFLKNRDEPLYRIDTNPRSARATIALKRSRRRKK
jgi:hypothetical protein